MLAKLRKLAGDYGFTGLGRSGPKPLSRGKHKFRKVSSASLPAKFPVIQVRILFPDPVR